jgi:putative peptidoglycan lipid II flippase
VLKALGPRLFGLAAFQANFFVATNLGSSMTDGPNRVAAFEYAYQLFMLPHGIFALSLANIAFPTMSRLLGTNDLDGMKRVLVSTLRQIIFLALPAALGLGLLSKPLVQSLLQAGQFQSDSTEMVSHALFCFSFGLLSYGVVEILTRGFYSLNDTRTPVLVAVGTVALNLILSWLLVGPLYQGGLALALALSTTLEMILLALLLRRKIGPLDPDNSRALPITIFKIVLAADAMGLALFIALWLLQGPLDSGNKLLVLILTLLLIGFGGAVYFAAAYLLKIEELHSVVHRFLRR